MSPQPGTRTASTRTQISFRGISAYDIGSITVTGSRSGRVSGKLKSHSDNQGASWVPSTSLRRGETVTVRTALDITSAKNGDFTFRVGNFATPPSGPIVPLDNVPPGKRASFRSRPDLGPPLVTVTPGAKQTAPGFVFITPKSKIDEQQAGPEIVDNRGQPIWFSPLPGITAATDFRTQTYLGQPVLTYWQGTSRLGMGTGELVMLDQHYKVKHRLTSSEGFKPDLHEFLITPHNTAVFITYVPVKADLRKYGGAKNGSLVDSVIKEVELNTGLVRFEWHSIGHIGQDESFLPPTKNAAVPWDYVHANAASYDTDGALLISSRSTSTAFKIDPGTGAIQWRLGGKHSDFKLGAGAKFAFQHDVRSHGSGVYTVFDNSNGEIHKLSRALTLKLDPMAHTATLLKALANPRGRLAATQGDNQVLPDGGAMVGWGSQRYFSEFGPNGDLRWDARVSTGYETYRAYRLPWVGLPTTTPRTAAQRNGGGMNVYASWNGSTETASWEVLAGPDATHLTSVASAPRNGFETQIAVAKRQAYVKVIAHDAAGNALATSPATRLK